MKENNEHFAYTIYSICQYRFASVGDTSRSVGKERLDGPRLGHDS